MSGCTALAVIRPSFLGPAVPGGTLFRLRYLDAIA
jgi:hypothetical protein